ncbi:MAG: helix-turn-helix domain-containing protein [Gammaproteobacteria bacterium]|nr:helix-turn-helix domain-containing protein [Gammaproteobacteria bacterium]
MPNPHTAPAGVPTDRSSQSANEHHQHGKRLARASSACGTCSIAQCCAPHLLLPELETRPTHTRILTRGSVLLEQGADYQTLFVVRSGSFKASMTSGDGREQITGFHLPGDVLGLDGLSSGLHGCRVQALETASVCHLPVLGWPGVLRDSPLFARAMRRMLSAEIVRMQSLMLLLGTAGATERVAAFLLSLSARHARRGLSARRFQLSMSRDEIASYLGLAMETVSRQFTRFQHDGVLHVERRAIEIRDMPALIQLAGGPAAHRDDQAEVLPGACADGN